MTYLAKCPGKCSQAVPRDLTWVKFQESSRIQAGPIPGLWGSDLLTKAGSTFKMTLPKGLESGEYVSVYSFAYSTLGGFPINICSTDYETRDPSFAQRPKQRASGIRFDHSFHSDILF